jgi:phosphate transport system protein
MVSLEPELHALKENLLEMMDLVTSQLTKCRKALVKLDVEAAEEVLAAEKRVNALELSIDKDCENILALYNPVATDLRLVLASLKIGNDLERIGDNANALAKFFAANLHKKEKSLADKFSLEPMFDTAIEMLNDMSKAVKDNNTDLARKTMKKDVDLNEYGKNAINVATDLIKENPDDIKLILRLFSITRRMERIGDLIKNLGEEVVFHVEAKVIKHKKEKHK